MSKLKKILFNKGSTAAYAIISAIFTLVPEDSLLFWKLNDKWQDSTNILINRLVICVVIFVVANVIYYAVYRKIRKRVQITGENFTIQIEYGDLFSISNGKIVINFDECFTTKVGDAPSEIKATSVCGQYLSKNPIQDMQTLIDSAGVKPEKGKSEFKGQTKYKPGTIVPHDKYLLMAFAELDKNGLGHLTYEEFLDCLNTLWKQIDLHHGTDDVYIPVLGSKITRFDRELTQQELLDIMTASYTLSSNRMKKPYQLYIVCKERDGFSLDDVKGID